jgi:hypothetical protein
MVVPGTNGSEESVDSGDASGGVLLAASCSGRRGSGVPCVGIPWEQAGRQIEGRSGGGEERWSHEEREKGRGGDGAAESKRPGRERAATGRRREGESGRRGDVSGELGFWAGWGSGLADWGGGRGVPCARSRAAPQTPGFRVMRCARPPPRVTCRAAERPPMPQLLWRRQTGWAFNNSDGEKKGGYRGFAGEDFIPYMTIFSYWGGDREAVEVALRLVAPRSCKRNGTAKKQVNALHRKPANTPLQSRSLQENWTASAPPRHLYPLHESNRSSRAIPAKKGEDERC